MSAVAVIIASGSNEFISFVYYAFAGSEHIASAFGAVVVYASGHWRVQGRSF